MHRDAINATGLGCIMIVGAAIAIFGIIHPLFVATPTWNFVLELVVRLGGGALAGFIAWKLLCWCSTGQGAMRLG